MFNRFNKIKFLIITTAALSFFVFSDKTQVQGAACTVTAARWLNTAAVVGQSVKMIVTVSNAQDCQGVNIGINIFESDITDFDDLLVSLLNNPFSGSNNDFVIEYTLTDADYIKGENESEMLGGETIYFTASAFGQTNYVTSNSISFKKTQTGTLVDFDLNPKVVANTSSFKADFDMRLRVTIDLNHFNNICGSSTNSFRWYIMSRDQFVGSDFERISGDTVINRTQVISTYNLDQSITLNLSPSEYAGGSSDYYASVYCSRSIPDSKLTESSRIKITFGSASSKNWACIAANNKFACSPANLTNCSDVSDCSRGPCQEIGKNLCGQDAGSGTVSAPGPGGGNKPQDVRIDFSIENPIESEDFLELIGQITTWIFNLAIPIAVAMIVYAGVMFLISRGDISKITKAKNILLYAVIGLTIIFIGKGFITLIESILNLGKNP
jgi:hypothetical protein